MKNLLLIAITILAVGCSGKDESTTETKPVEEKELEVKEEAKTEEPLAESKPNTDGVKMDDLEFRDGIAYFEDSSYTGKSFKMYVNGQKKAEMNFKNGKPDGLVTWYENGKKEAKMNFKNGKPEGLSFGWYENGQKLMETNMKDGKPEGLVKSWHENGQKEIEANFKDGKEDGLQVMWYVNGEKRLETNFSEGKQHGDSVTWFANGKIRSEEYYRFGIIRAAKYWDNKGEPADSLEEAEGGVNLDQTINRKGFIYLKDSDTPYTGKLFEFHANRLKKKEMNFKNGKKEGSEIAWHEIGGQKMAEVNSINGKQEGLYEEWHDNGQKKSERTYKDGRRDGLYVAWHENGQKGIESNFKDGEKISEKLWNSKGEPVDSFEEAQK